MKLKYKPNISYPLNTALKEKEVQTPSRWQPTLNFSVEISSLKSISGEI